MSLIESLEEFLKAPPPPFMSDLAQTIGRYQVSRELGRGMMGVVYLAHDPDLGRDIALKVIQYPNGATAEDQAGYELRFFAEAKSAARLFHPGIVVVHDVGRDPLSGAPFMALQFVPGKTLDRMLKERHRLEMVDALRIAKGVAEALHHAHAQGVVHRDIKPANIMILPNGDPMIMDFGIAKLETSRLTATGQFVGTPLYMSPEQAMVQPVDGRSDIFSLGSVLYEMLTGAPAFYGESITKILLQLIHNEPKAPSAVVTSLSGYVDHVLSRCLAKDPYRRYQTAQELADDLKDILETKTPRSMTLWSTPAALETSPSVGGGPWIAGTRAGMEASSAAAAARVSISESMPATKSPSASVALGSAERSGLGSGERAAGGSIDWTTETHALPRKRQSNRVLEGTLVGAVFALVGILWMVVSFSIPAPEAHQFLQAQATPSIVITPAPTVVQTPTPVPVEPAQVTVDFEHGLKSGQIRVFVDGKAVMTENLAAVVTGRIIGIARRKGRVTEALQIEPGRRKIRVQVAWDDNVKTEETQTTLKAGGRLRLKVKLGGLAGLRKDLSLEWN